jgi:hypothetical protein
VRDRRLPPISLGDALRVEADLRPADAETNTAIDALLGVDRTRAVQTTPTLGPWKPNEQPPLESTGTHRIPADDDRPRTPTERPPVLRGAKTTSQFTRRISFDAPAWTANALPFRPAAGSDASLPPPPLFSGGHVRAILSAMFARLDDGSEVDIERATLRLAQTGRLDSIPFVPVPTLRRGAQVLVDRTEALDPLRDDLRQLLLDIERLFGRGHIEVLSFTHCPSARDAARRGVADSPRSRPFAWRAPVRGMPILMVSDFTLAPIVDDDADVASVGEWQEFARDVRAAGCHPIGLVPYAPSRWPPALASFITFVHWSERTTARQLMRVLRETWRSAESGR